MTEVHLSGRQIQVLAHPLRIRLLGRLRLEGPATATQLAEALATNTGATSYHLRQLAEAGLVGEEDRPGSGRQRWWRALHDLSSWQRSDYPDDPDAVAAVDWLEAHQLRLMVDKIEAWHTVASSESPQWRDVAGMSDYALTLDPAQLRDLQADLEDVVERHQARALADPRPGARQILFFSACVPLVQER
ncbi:winged helix-turn-helix domain-containing protein [Actinoplanes sp. NEAU-A12]|uniref:Winged helix-turn-helix domain-containing protein n=1 Tax=Actinoplanes sandaracinus TaxID=3045177 RepID=A0ABT6WV47_9ACTN|nr:winged helix-turn-helix domain-containing protein [Actinoplanes sandaracinus]MDI6103621.1 winged helix-turn-helix domain-containing protein [Actinoplanes sandaracinus]